MLQLNKDLLIGKGGRREVYLDPNDKSKCIKITPLANKIAGRNSTKHWYKKLRPLKCFDENTNELKAYKYMIKKYGINSNVFNHIPKFYNEINTNLGWGIEVEYLKNIESLKNFIDKNGVNEQLISALKDIFSNFVEYNVEIRDYTPLNYVVKYVDNKLKIYMIDGLGSAILIPIHRIKYFGKKQIKRRIGKMLDKLTNFYPKYAKEFESLKEFVKRK